jgi:predicted RNA-binding Zn-ribbon protein involved in translation (DUF1610 family)
MRKIPAFGSIDPPEGVNKVDPPGAFLYFHSGPGAGRGRELDFLEPEMAKRYYCPHCRSNLNPGTKIIMRIRRGRQKGLILLSPQVGNYTSILPEEFVLRRGESVHVSCPVCGADLISPVNRKLGEVLLRQGETDFLPVYFSRTYGEQATFVVSEEKVRSYGEHADQYQHVNFFGEGRGKD